MKETTESYSLYRYASTTDLPEIISLIDQWSEFLKVDFPFENF